VVVLPGIVEGQGLFRVGAGQDKFTQIKQGGCERGMGLQHKGGIMLALSQSEALLPQLPRGLQLPLCVIKLPQSPQHREELQRLTYLRRVACLAVSELFPVIPARQWLGIAPSGDTGEVRRGAGGWARVKSGFLFPLLADWHLHRPRPGA
jgi:hypothetical protein